MQLLVRPSWPSKVVGVSPVIGHSSVPPKVIQVPLYLDILDVCIQAYLYPSYDMVSTLVYSILNEV